MHCQTEKIPQEIKFKEEFKIRYMELLGNNYEEFIDYSSSYIRKSIRVNTLKIEVSDLKKRLEKEWNLIPVPWCKEGFFINYRHGKRYDIGNLLEHQLGYIYVQDAASMIPPIVLDPKPGDIVLDLCSAPGSKTTQLAQYMKNQGLIIANDVDSKRLKPLGLNLQRCGVKNTLTTLRSNKKLKKEFFDKVLVDAPCSGTGTIRRSLKTMQMWSPGLVKRMAKEQKRLIKEGFDLLKPGGFMVYSTCTLEPEEDEGVVSWLLNNENASLEDIRIPIKRSEPITNWLGEEYHPSVSKCLRIYPQDNDTEGFFVALIRKA